MFKEMQMKPVRREVFRAYDIRGLVDRDFDPEWVEALGRAAGTFFRRKGYSRAVVGRDVRPSSPGYQERMVVGLCSTGMDVYFLGMVGTPEFYFAIRHLRCDAGVMITASHNPPQYNGFKLWGGPTTLSPAEIAEVHGIMAAGDFASGAGLASRHETLPAYLDDLARGMELPRPIKVVVDGGNGTSGEATAMLLERCGAEVVRLYCEPDPAFPNHHPDPAVAANMRDLAARVLAEGAELGVGLDGDGDRLGIVDEKGRLWEGDETAALLAAEALAEHPGAAVLGDVKCSKRYFADVARLGGRPVMAATGHSLMKARMLAEGAAFGGELSGHFFWGGRFHGCEDASHAALKVLHLLARDPAPLSVPLSARLAHWPRTSTTPEIQVRCADGVKFRVVEEVRAHYRALAAAGECAVVETDGARVEYPDGWGLVRCSNTQPVIVLRFEADDDARLVSLRAEVEALVRGRVAALGG
jgi:phosphomannomutase/phosphoglucomutase